jgi:radical SAM superfamily enzyme YgiQ (UPF0313 family)
VRYEGVVYRPPSEAGSLILQATLACPHNKCAFCGMYKERRFRVRPLEEVIEDLDIAREVYGPHGVRTIFLADGNTAVLPTDTLVAIGEAARARFPDLQRITMYGSAKFRGQAAAAGADRRRPAVARYGIPATHRAAGRARIVSRSRSLSWN